jgi:hypothetical protein
MMPGGQLAVGSDPIEGKGVELDTLGLVTRARTYPTLASWVTVHWESIWRGCNR